jgi:hypothetical protein
MGFDYDITFYDAENNDIGGMRLERKHTHYDSVVRAFWSELCYSEIPKKEFVDRFQKKISEQDINSEAFQYLIGGLAEIVGTNGWSSAIIIGIGGS